MSHPFEEPSKLSAEQAASNKCKRLLSQSDEEIIKELDNKNLPYRRGWPQLSPLPLDCTSHGIGEVIPYVERLEILDKAREVFAAQRLDTGWEDIVFRTPRDVDDDNPKTLAPFVTLLFTADMVKGAGRIERAIVRLRQEFKLFESFQTARIECLHLTCVLTPPTYAITHKDTDIMEKADGVVDFVVEQIKDEPWLCIEVVRRGLVKDARQCPPTVIITTPNAGKPHWYTTILPKIRTAFVDITPAFRIEVLYKESFMHSRRKCRPSSFVNEPAYQKHVSMGSSVGIQGTDDSGGTLGGLVKLSGGDGDQPLVPCAITNWHVVRDDRLDNLLSPTTGALAPDNPTLRDKPQYMLTPSTQDHQGLLGTLQKTLNMFQREVEAGNASSQEYDIDTDKRYKKVDKYDRHIGHVFAASAFRSVKAPKYATINKTGGVQKAKPNDVDFTLDWALIRISNTTGRTPVNLMPDVRVPYYADTNIVSGTFSTKWSTFDMQKDMVKVGKFGRTTGWTFGQINAVPVRINPQVAAFHQIANPAYCFEAIPNPTGASFMQEGDSGSILLHDGSGAWLGLLFGATANDFGMFIPIDLVFQDIEKVTGKAVVSPTFTNWRDWVAPVYD